MNDNNNNIIEISRLISSLNMNNKRNEGIIATRVIITKSKIG
jgi:hypothetical protein